jgi:hypothetical protein
MLQQYATRAAFFTTLFPSTSQGIKTVWVNRPSIRPGAEATKPAVAQPTAEVQNLAELVKLLA